MSWYELHVTVEKQPSLTDTLDFDRYCREVLKVKCNLIELSNGKYKMQLMLAAKAAWNSDEDARTWAADMSTLLALAGWDVVRVKLESELKSGPNAYFEAHWKFMMKSPENFQIFNHFIGVFNQPLEDADPATWPKFMSSRNILKDGVYYLSQRNYSGDYKAAKKQFDKASKQIENYTLPMEGCHYERVIYDSFPGLDEGWTN